MQQQDVVFEFRPLLRIRPRLRKMRGLDFKMFDARNGETWMCDSTKTYIVSIGHSPQSAYLKWREENMTSLRIIEGPILRWPANIAGFFSTTVQ